MRITAYAIGGERHTWVRDGVRWAYLGPVDLVDVLRSGGLPRDLAWGDPGPPDGAHPLTPVGRPGKLVFAGLNYHDHVAALPAGMYSVPTEPVTFAKLPTALCATGDDIVIPAGETSTVDYEAELAAIIGRTTKGVPADRALEHVFGYVVVNDVSHRDLQMARGQLDLGKGLDTFCPMGPDVVLTDELPDPSGLRIWTRVNGELRQDSNTADQIFSLAQIIEHVSRYATLEPGDVVSTGTPAGCAAEFDPPGYLQRGDTVTAGIDGIGEVTNGVV